MRLLWVYLETGKRVLLMKHLNVQIGVTLLALCAMAVQVVPANAESYTQNGSGGASPNAGNGGGTSGTSSSNGSASNGTSSSGTGNSNPTSSSGNGNATNSSVPSNVNSSVPSDTGNATGANTAVQPGETSAGTGAKDYGASNDEVRWLVRNGKAASMRKLLAFIGANYDGRIINIQLNKTGKSYRYSVKLLTNGNRLKIVELDALNLTPVTTASIY